MVAPLKREKFAAPETPLDEEFVTRLNTQRIFPQFSRRRSWNEECSGI
jgi:hypothetical protein